MKSSLKVLSPTSNCNSTVAIGDFGCPLATIIWNSGARPSLSIVCRANNQILRQTASRMAFDIALVSMGPSLFNSLKSPGNYSNLGLFLNGKFVDSGRNVLSPSGVTWTCGRVWSSLTAICL